MPKDRAIVRPSMGLGDGSVVTLFGSGLTIKRAQQIVSDILHEDIGGTLIVVAGRNSELALNLQNIPKRDRLVVRILGFVGTVDDLIAASDLVVTKAGGLIVSEVLARGRPLVVIDPTPA